MEPSNDALMTAYAADKDGWLGRFGAERWSEEAVYAALALHRRHAELLAAAGVAEGVAAYLEAEALQRVIGTWASGSGEGLASMGALYELMAARARLHERLGGAEHLAAALAAWTQIAADPNGLGRWAIRERDRAAHGNREPRRDP